jgi:hypothetical protein
MTGKPYSLIVARPNDMSPEGFDWAATIVQRQADALGLDVVVATDAPRDRVFRRLVKAFPFGGAR